MTHFNEVANEWDSPEKIGLIKALALKTKINLDIKQKVKILDFGCGTGLFGLEFIELASELVGVDTSSGMLKVMKQKAEGLSNVRTLNVNLEESHLDETFDLIISSMAFHHLDSPDKMLKKMKNMLNPEGKIVIVDLDKEDGSFHPDNIAMGVKHFGFSKEELESWSKGYSSLRYEIIHEVEKNGRVYPQFMLELRR